MKRVFDASALLNIIRVLGSEAHPYLKDNYILTLTLYEVGNALWKEAALLNRLSISEALSLLEAIKQACSLLNMVSPINTSLALELAHKLKITYYDASYITASHELNAELITDDEKLKRRVEKEKNTLLKTLGREVVIRSTRELIKGRR
ncbi:MAG: type II toxin-antitoxin system VapC family toxin [Desulfurococcales archaeon]|nr:type II toxin-antitoxin system VapC family toxin [Desulfurococcales archaeon]